MLRDSSIKPSIKKQESTLSKVSKDKLWARCGGKVGRRGRRRPNLTCETKKSGGNGNKAKETRLYTYTGYTGYCSGESDGELD